MRRFWKKYHKWVGLCLTLFVLVFCLSGIVLNHRRTFSSWQVSRAWLPSDYHYDNWNNGIVRGTLRLSGGDVLIYGNAGVWLTDTRMTRFQAMNDGLPKGIDNRKVSNVVRGRDGQLWCAALYGVYRHEKGQWQKADIPLDGERMSDITMRGDTMAVLSRSFVFTSLPPYNHFTRHELKTPKDYSPKVSLFKTVWQLHSGELFGLGGRLVVDCVAVVIIVLCLTGIVYFFFPGMMKRRRKQRKDTRTMGKTLAFSVRWHNRLGRWTVILTILLAFTGACLRPPLMIPLAMTSTRPLPGSTLDSDNAFHDKLRAMRWDAATGAWLLSTSAGFYSLASLDGVPVKLDGAPMISPMGINVFEPCDSTGWLVGSFSGLYRWHPATGSVTDYFTGKKPEMHGMRSFAAGASVSGFSRDLCGQETVFEYGRGATTKGIKVATSSMGDKSVHGTSLLPQVLPQMPAELQSQPMSLWNFALELHVGRCYSPLLGPFSSLFVFLAGTLLSLLLFSGWLINRKPKRKQQPKDTAA